MNHSIAQKILINFVESIITSRQEKINKAVFKVDFDDDLVMALQVAIERLASETDTEIGIENYSTTLP